MQVLPAVPLSKKTEASKQSFWTELIKIKLKEIAKVNDRVVTTRSFFIYLFFLGQNFNKREAFGQVKREICGQACGQAC